MIVTHGRGVSFISRSREESLHPRLVLRLQVDDVAD